jgi:ribosomal protein S18 acetylase RimI-like enzyme
MSNRAFTVRRALVTDAAAIARIQVEGWQTAYRGMIPDEVLDAMTVEERTERWTNILSSPRGTSLVTEDEGRVMGWAGFGRARGDDPPAGRGEIYGFYVAPGNWRSGVGSAMWRETCRHMITAGFDSGELWVLEANVAARSFYEAMGCTLDSPVAQAFDIEGHSIPEVKYVVSLG